MRVQLQARSGDRELHTHLVKISIKLDLDRWRSKRKMEKKVRGRKRENEETQILDDVWMLQSRQHFHFIFKFIHNSVIFFCSSE